MRTQIVSYRMQMLKHIRTFVAALLLAHVASPAAADQLNMIINGKSFHMGSDYRWNEDNFGMGFEYDFANRSQWIKSGIVNGFRDSLDNMSYMAGGGLRRRFFETEQLAGLYFDAGLVAFLMSRQDINDNQPFPGILPMITLGNRHVGLNLSYVPQMAVHDIAHADEIDPNIKGVFFLQAKIAVGHRGR